MKRWELHLSNIHFELLGFFCVCFNSLVGDYSTCDWEVVGFTPDWLIPETLKVVLMASLLCTRHQLLRLERLDHGARHSWDLHCCCLLFPQGLVQRRKQGSHPGIWQPTPLCLSSACTTVIVSCNFLFYSDSSVSPWVFSILLHVTVFCCCCCCFQSHDSHLCLVVGPAPDCSHLPSCINSPCLPLCASCRYHSFVTIVTEMTQLNSQRG